MRSNGKIKTNLSTFQQTVSSINKRKLPNRYISALGPKRLLLSSFRC